MAKAKLSIIVKCPIGDAKIMNISIRVGQIIHVCRLDRRIMLIFRAHFLL